MLKIAKRPNPGLRKFSVLSEFSTANSQLIEQLYRIKRDLIKAPILLNFLNYDFHDCKCNSILFAMYKDMIKHSHGGQNILKLVHTKIQLAAKTFQKQKCC
jgi:hypothetical protein